MLLILALRKQNVFVKLGPAWPTQWVPRLPELHSETKSNTKKGQIRLPIHHSSASKPAAHGGLRRHGVHLGIKGQPAMVALDTGLCVLWRLWCYLSEFGLQSETLSLNKQTPKILETLHWRKSDDCSKLLPLTRGPEQHLVPTETMMYVNQKFVHTQ